MCVEYRPLKIPADIICFPDLSRIASVVVVIVGFLLSPAALWAADQNLELGDDDYVVVQIDQSVDLRAMAKKYLNNPDLWPIILKLNGLDDVEDLSTVRELRLPAGPLSAATAALKASLEAIQLANQAGAQLFAPVLLKTAIDLRDSAVVEKNIGMFDNSVVLSGKSITNATTAKIKSEENRDVEAEALLLDRRGNVEGQKPIELSWSERSLSAILSEQEKLRTLSDSTAQVVFRDASRLRLNPNSQAVIQRMRVDPLTQRSEAKISLVKGDFYALLTSESRRSRLEVALPSADAKIDSGNFWVSQSDGAAKFSNYEEKPIAITAGGETLVLGRNEGAVVQAGQVPGQRVRLEDSIALIKPKNESVVFNNSVDLAWEPAQAAEGYWAELASDPRFDHMAKSLPNIPDNKLDRLKLEPGVYFWRVAVLDQFGLPGQMSDVGQFEVRTDVTPPFLRILSPGDGEIFRHTAIQIQGETEPNARISINGTAVEPNLTGGFSAGIELQAGANVVKVKSVDLAGNETVRLVEVTVSIDSRSDIRFDASLPRDRSGTFLSPGDTLTLSGEVVADARIQILDAQGQARSETFTRSDGKFVLNVPLGNVKEDLKIVVTTASGYAYQEAIRVEVQKDPPAINVEPPVRPITSQQQLEVSVISDQQAKITINGKLAEIRDGRYRSEIELSEGPNTIEIIAENAFGLTSVETRTVTLDTRQPQLLSQSLSISRQGKQEFMTIRIGADDASGLAKTSKVEISSGGKMRAGTLRFNKAAKMYQGHIETPPRGDDGAYTIAIELVDVAGNVNKVKLVQ
jgi:hypothetical protein